MAENASNAESSLTIVIPTWNQRELLRRCLRSLQKQTQIARILLVDNGSTDGTGKMVREHFPHVEILSLDSNRGFAAAVNRGLEQVRTPCVALLNNDTEADPGWVEAGLSALEGQSHYSFFASRIIQMQNRECLDSAGDCYSRRGLPLKRGNGSPVDRFQKEEPVLGASAGAAFYRMSLFEEIGPLDESFYMYLEDVEFSLRSQLAGHRCLYLPNAVVFHYEAASDPDRGTRGSRTERGKVYYSPTRVFWITRNRWQLMLLYQPSRNTPWLVFGWTKSLLFHLLKGGQAAAFLRGLWSGLLLTPSVLKKRRELNRRWGGSRKELCRLFQEC